MSRLLEHRRLILGLTALATLGGIWYGLLFRKQQAGLTRLQRDIESTEDRISEWVAATRSLSNFHEEFTRLQERHHQLLSRIPGRDHVHRLAEDVTRTGKESGCRVTHVGIPFSRLFSGEARPGSPAGGLDVIPLRLALSGRFLEAGAFMEALSDLPYFAGFGEVEIERMPGGMGEVDVDLTVQIYVRDTSGTRGGEV